MATAVPELTAAEKATLESRIEAEAQRFELRALLEVLSEIGYLREDVLFESATEGRSASVIQAIRFSRRPLRTVTITVQLGLLGDNSLLPSYFLLVAEQSPDPGRFYDFIRFFDHQLIDNLYGALHPEIGKPHPTQAGDRLPERERAASVYGDYDATLRALLRMSMPGTLGTLHWITQLHFPEFRVRVKRCPFGNVSDTHACRTGKSRLDGTGILGRIYVAEISGFQLDLITEDERDLSGREQADVVLPRLRERFLPLLAPFRLALSVRLVVVWHSSFAYVDAPDDPDKSFLGYNRLKGPRDVQHTTVLYHGITGEPARHTNLRG